MPTDEFFQAFDRLNQGLRDLSTFNAVNDANETVKQIKTAQMKDFEQRQAIQGVANDLATRLSGFGVDPGKAGQIGANMIPAAPPQAGSADQAILNPGQFSDATVAKGQQMYDQRLGLQRQQIAGAQQQRAGQADAKLDKERRAARTTFQKEFNKFDFGKLEQSRRQAQGAMKLIDSGSPLTASAIGTLMARASGEVGNLTEAERSLFQGQMDLISRVKRAASVNALGKLPKDDLKALRGLAQQYYDLTGETEQNIAETLASQLSSNELFQGENPDHLIAQVSGGRVKQRKGQTAAQAPVGQAATQSTAPAGQIAPGITIRGSAAK